MDSVNVEEVKEMMKHGYSYEKISNFLKAKYSSVTKGLSVRSVRRFCKENNIQRLNETEIDEIVGCAVEQVCSYTDQGVHGWYLAQQSIKL